MKKIIAMGEGLIDFIPMQTGCEIKDVESFSGRVGGAPCNVAAMAAKLGGNSATISMLGKDGFGDKIVETLNSVGVDTTAVLRTDKANTALAFVSLQKDGNREFSFYRNPSADMLMSADDINEKWFSNAGIFHFCSVALIPSPMRKAHIKALDIARQNNMFISFDPNLRFPLWDDKELLKETVLEFLKYADLTKISDEELEFITGHTDISSAAKMLFDNYPKLKAILYSEGKKGASIYTRNFMVSSKQYPVRAIDTTGAGDCINGAFLYKLAEADITPDTFENADSGFIQSSLDFANACSSLSVTQNGAISSYPDMKQLMEFIKKY